MTAAVGMTTREHEQQTAGAVAEEETAAAVTAVKESGSTAAPGQLFLDDVYNMVGASHSGPCEREEATGV
jgi:hypothetical protein